MTELELEDDASDGRVLTWAVLLGRWVELARSAVALPDDSAGRAMKASISDIIMLQAVWMALGEVGRLSADQRQLGLDQAAVLIDRHERAVRDRFVEGLPAAVREVIDDARERLEEELGREGDA